jgi:hypothetical protein
MLEVSFLVTSHFPTTESKFVYQLHTTIKLCQALLGKERGRVPSRAMTQSYRYFGWGSLHQNATKKMNRTKVENGWFCGAQHLLRIQKIRKNLFCFCLCTFRAFYIGKKTAAVSFVWWCRWVIFSA